MENIIVGTGIYLLIRLPSVPKVGSFLNLGNQLIKEGCYRVTKVDTIVWDGDEYPHLHIDRVRNIPKGEKKSPVSTLNI